jgi:hypothetical protein
MGNNEFSITDFQWLCRLIKTASARKYASSFRAEFHQNAAEINLLSCEKVR